MHEHPTEALLDAYTILRHKKTLKGLQWRSWATLSQPRHVPLPPSQQVWSAHNALWAVRVPARKSDLSCSGTAHHAYRGRCTSAADVVMTLRVQKERLAGTKISFQDLARYQMTMPRLKLAKKYATRCNQVRSSAGWS